MSASIQNTSPSPASPRAADEEEVKVVETKGQDHPRELPPMFCRTVVTRSATELDYPTFTGGASNATRGGGATRAGQCLITTNQCTSFVAARSGAKGEYRPPKTGTAQRRMVAGCKQLKLMRAAGMAPDKTPCSIHPARSCRQYRGGRISFD